jgi:hypothetical protein
VHPARDLRALCSRRRFLTQLFRGGIRPSVDGIDFILPSLNTPYQRCKSGFTERLLNSASTILGVFPMWSNL